MRVINPGFVIEDEINGLEVLKKIERAGRTCYKSEAKITEDSCKEFTKKIIASGHHSVLEHEKVTVRVVCDRSTSHQGVRHRIATFSQESQRFCNYSKDGFGNEITFVQPDFTLEEDDLELLRLIEAHYFRKIAQGKKPQQARYFLPNGTKTEFVVTMNLRSWRHFFELRTSSKADAQIQEIANGLLAEFKRLIPVVFDDIKVE